MRRHAALFIVICLILVQQESLAKIEGRSFGENLSVEKSVARHEIEDRPINKRSQRNANILYRYCRQSGEAPQFCLKYAVRMIFATGH